MKYKSIIFGIKGLDLTLDEIDFLKKERPWGIILFSRNIFTLHQTRRLISKIKKITKNKNFPILIDQEGGKISRLNRILNLSFFSQRYFAEIYNQHRNIFNSYYKNYINLLFQSFVNLDNFQNWLKLICLIIFYGDFGKNLILVGCGKRGLGHLNAMKKFNKVPDIFCDFNPKSLENLSLHHESTINQSSCFT